MLIPLGVRLQPLCQVLPKRHEPRLIGRTGFFMTHRDMTPLCRYPIEGAGTQARTVSAGLISGEGSAQSWRRRQTHHSFPGGVTHRNGRILL